MILIRVCAIVCAVSIFATASGFGEMWKVRHDWKARRGWQSAAVGEYELILKLIRQLIVYLFACHATRSRLGFSDAEGRRAAD